MLFDCRRILREGDPQAGDGREVAGGFLQLEFDGRVVERRHTHSGAFPRSSLQPDRRRWIPRRLRSCTTSKRRRSLNRSNVRPTAKTTSPAVTARGPRTRPYRHRLTQFTSSHLVVQVNPSSDTDHSVARDGTTSAASLNPVKPMNICRTAQTDCVRPQARSSDGGSVLNTVSNVTASPPLLGQPLHLPPPAAGAAVQALNSMAAIAPAL